MQKDYNREQVAFAGFWVRLAAYIIDSVIVAVGLAAVRLVMSGVMSLMEGTFLGGNLLFTYTLKDIIVYVCGALYFILCTYYTGTTLGKRVMNLRVVSAVNDGKPTFFQMLYRETVGRFLSGFVVGLGYLMIGLDAQKRGLHDILCDTRVIYAKKVKVYPQYQNPVPYGQGPGQRVPMGPYNMTPPGNVPPPQGNYVPPVPPKD